MSEELETPSAGDPIEGGSSFSEIAAEEIANTPDLVDDDVEQVDLSVSDELDSIDPIEGNAPTQAEAVAEWRQAFRDNGLEIPDDMDLVETAKALAQARRVAEQVPTLQRLAALGYQAQGQWDAFQAWQQQQEAINQQQQQYAPPGYMPQQQAQPQQPNPWQAPEYDPTWEQLVRKNPETGLLEPISMSVDPSVPQKLQKYYAHQKDMLTKFAANPAGFMEETGIAQQYREQALQLARQEIQQAIQAQQQQAFISQTVEQHAPWMYVQDEQGNYATDNSGKRVLSDLGMDYANAVQFIKRGNPQDPKYQDVLATLIVQGQRQARNAAAPAAPKVDPKVAFTKQPAAPSRRIAGGAGRTPNRIGSAMAGNGEPQNPRHTYKRMLEEAFGLNKEDMEV